MDSLIARWSSWGGGSLTEKFVDTPLPAQQAAQLAETLARATHYAHQQGIVHCDLNPANVLLTAAGVPKITGFGLAKLLGSQQEEADSTSVIDRLPSYMAPEQVDGKSHQIGPATDVYALGAILYKLLTGQPPFLGQTLRETRQQVLSQEPVPPSQLEPEVPRDLEAICLKGLAKEPAQRYSSAEALAADLRCFLADEPISLETLGPWERLLRWTGYEILGELGRGGMGVVYKARQVSFNRIVALKLILAVEHAGPQELARFRAEAEAMTRLRHPNIVQVYEVGEQEGHPFLALELVDGGSMAQKLAGRPQPPRLAAQLVETLARAMHCAHQQGIVHRDLKLANVLLTADGTPKISDFGVAKILEWGLVITGQTPSGAIVGTPSYMSPEQALGKRKSVGPPADVFALGAILYELLAGRPPFRGETPLDTIRQVAELEPVPPSRLQLKVPRDLDGICLKCLQKEPSNRYASAEALAEDLRCFVEGKPIQARPISAWERLVKWLKRRLRRPTEKGER
jgi:serine/threonine protein kinase